MSSWYFVFGKHIWIKLLLCKTFKNHEEFHCSQKSNHIGLMRIAGELTHKKWGEINLFLQLMMSVMCCRIALKWRFCLLLFWSFVVYFLYLTLYTIKHYKCPLSIISGENHWKILLAIPHQYHKFWFLLLDNAMLDTNGGMNHATWRGRESL